MTSKRYNTQSRISQEMLKLRSSNLAPELNNAKERKKKDTCRAVAITTLMPLVLFN